MHCGIPVYLTAWFIVAPVVVETSALESPAVTTSTLFRKKLPAKAATSAPPTRYSIEVGKEGYQTYSGKVKENEETTITLTPSSSSSGHRQVAEPAARRICPCFRMTTSASEFLNGNYSGPTLLPRQSKKIGSSRKLARQPDPSGSVLNATIHIHDCTSSQGK